MAPEQALEMLTTEPVLGRGVTGICAETTFRTATRYFDMRPHGDQTGRFVDGDVLRTAAKLKG